MKKTLLLILLLTINTLAGWMNVDSINIKQKFRNKKFNTDALLYIKSSDSLLDTCNMYYKTGRIGVGTNNPTTAMHIYGATGGSLTLEGPNGKYSWQASPSAADELVLYDYTSTNEILTITDNKLGILTDILGGPTAELHVNGSAIIEDSLYLNGPLIYSGSFYSDTLVIDSLNVSGTTISTNGNIALNSNYLNYDCTDGIGLYFNASNYPFITNNSSVFGTARRNLFIYDNTTLAAGVGGGIAFGGNYTGTNDKYTFAAINAYKTNATSGNYSGQLHFQTTLNGASPATRLVLDENGNFGIGTLTPSTKLYVNGKTTINNNLIVSDSLFTSVGNGRVGIGTITPDRKLDVYQSLSALIAKFTGASGKSAYIYCDNASQGIGNYNSSNGFYVDSTGNAVMMRNNNINTLYLNTSNNVGIGTTSPEGKLNIYNGSAGTFTPDVTVDDLVIESSTNAGITIVSPNTDQSAIYLCSPSEVQGAIFTWNTSDTACKIGSDATLGHLQFFAGGNRKAKIYYDGGMTVGLPTGESQGAGTLNAQAVYDDGAILTKYVLDYYYNDNFNKDTYKTEKKAVNKFLKYANLTKDINKYNDFVINNYSLPSFYDIEKKGEKPSIGMISQKCWEELEIKTEHIRILKSEIDSLKQELKEIRIALKTIHSN